MKNITLLFLILYGTVSLIQAQSKSKLAIIPQPSEIELNEGSFILNENTILLVPDTAMFGIEAHYLQSLMKEITRKDALIQQKLKKKKAENYLEIIYDPSIQNEEEYTLEINPLKITIKANNTHGVFNAIQTIRQLLPLDSNYKQAIIPALVIKDRPAFSWRGIHLDVSRHFFTTEYLKKHLDRLAFYKFNKFHFHLTDDQGWRIEIKKYPKLTEIGAWRSFNDQDSACMKNAANNPNFEIDSRFVKQINGESIYGGFYTQEEIKDLIKYAAERHIEIIPEIDMPGHMMAAIKAYPNLIEGNFSWGEIFSKPLCPCKDDVYIFSQNVLAEIIELFPSKYIHLGADEVDKTSWINSELCAEFMAQHGIEDVNKLQSHFIHEMQNFVESKGKKVIAWDEILEGGTNPNVTIMYWRGWVKDAPRKAVEGGSEVIMTPTNPLYFDYANNNTSVDNVYHMELIHKDIPEERRSLIRGAQANLWTEMIPTEAQADFQMYPRMLALSERVWTNKTNNYNDFCNRLLQHYPKLDNMGVNYRLPDIDGFAQENVYVGETEFMVNSPINGMQIHYTLDGSVPQMESPKLISSIKISQPTELKIALLSPSGVRGEIYTLNFKPSEMIKSASVLNPKKGLTCDFYNNLFKNTKEIFGTPAETFVVNNIASPKESASFGLKFKGYIDVPQTGIYSFFFTCDDGGVIYIDNKVVVDNDGQHSPILKSGQIALEKGLHPFQLDFLEAGGGYTLKLQYSYNGSSPQNIPDSWFKH